MKTESIEEQLRNQIPSPTLRFHKQMAIAPWSPAGRIRQQLLAGFGLAFLFLSAFLILSPQGRAWAQEVIHFFTLATSDTQPVETLSHAEDWAWKFDISLEEAEMLTGITAWVPAWVPETLIYNGAMTNPTRTMILISYNYLGMEGTGLVLIQQAITDDSACEICDMVGASAEVQPVLVGQAQGEYVTGVWAAIGDTGQWGWEDQPFMQRLRWQQNGMAYELRYMAPPESMSRDDLVMIASSLSSNQVTKAALANLPATETPGDAFLHSNYPLDRFAAQQEARFTLLLPAWMPEGYSLGGASCEQGEQPIVHLFYPESEKTTSSGLQGIRLSEQLVASGAECELCGFISGDWAAAETAYEYMVVGENASIEEVAIGSTLGNYVQGSWELAGENGREWVNDPDIWVLRWQSNGIAFQITYFGLELTLDDLVKIAKSIY